MKFFYPKPKGNFSIEITPLVDVVFQLIVFLMLSLGKMHSFLNIQLPALNQIGVDSESQIPTISLRLENQITEVYWNQKKITIKEIQEYLLKEKPKKIILKADKKVTYEDVILIFGEIQKFSDVELLLEYEYTSQYTL